MSLLICFINQEKIDKLEGTYEEDPDYKSFLIKEALPEVVRTSHLSRFMSIQYSIFYFGTEVLYISDFICLTVACQYSYEK